MARILLITDNKAVSEEIKTALLEHEIINHTDSFNIVDIMKAEAPDIIIADTDSKIDINGLYRQVKDFQVIKLLVIGNSTVPKDILADAHLFVSHPINQELVKSMISAGLRTRKTLIKQAKSNKELANSLYQLNVLYNISSQLAGSLSKDKLIDILNDGIDRSLNSDISCTLSFKDDKTPVLIINSNNKLSNRLIEALKLRAVLNYKNSGIDVTEMFSLEDIEVEQIIKSSIYEYDFEVLNFNKLISYIILEDKCYGYSEIFRETEFSSDDTKFFQTLVNQITLPLKSAILYQEIAQKNKELARLERLKSDFISIVSHELKTPLTSIKNSLDIISGGKTGAITESMQKFLDMAKRNVNNLSKLISNLLDMSKIEAGKMNCSLKSTSIYPVIQNVTQNLTQSLMKRNLKLNIKTDTNLKNIYADSDRIEQVLTNLITNAIKFSPDGGTISIKTKMINAEDIHAEECFSKAIEKLKGEYVQICVSDEGIGIRKEDFTRVFDKFEQLDSALSREVGGSGLGLSIAKQLIVEHNGAIWCDSIPNKGSSFYFVLPVSKEG